MKFFLILILCAQCVAQGTWLRAVAAPVISAPALITRTSSSNTGSASDVPLHCSGQVCNPTTFVAHLADPAYPGNAAILRVTYGSSQSITTITDDQGDSGSCAITAIDATNSRKLSICYIKNLTANAFTVTVTFSAATVAASVGVDQFCNLDPVNPVDGSAFAGTNGSGTSIAAGNVTGFAQSGDLLYQAAFASGGYTGLTGGTGWVVGSQAGGTWALTTADSHEGVASQWMVYNSTSTISPTMTRAPTGGWLTAAVAFKPATAGTCTNSGYIAGVQHENNYADFAGAYHLQVPNTGTAMLASFVCGACKLTGITDANNTWNQIGICTEQPTGGVNDVCFFYAAGMTARSNDLTLTQDDYTKHSTIVFYDLINVASSNAIAKMTPTIGTYSTSTGTFTPFVGFYPGITAGLIVYAGGDDTNTITGLVSGQVDADTFGGMPVDGPQPIDQNNAWAHRTVSSDSSNDFTLNLISPTGGVSSYAHAIISIQAASGAVSDIPSFIQSASLSNSASGTTVAVPLLNKTRAGASAGTLAAACYWNDAARTFSVADNINGAWTADSGPTTGTGGNTAWRFQMFHKASITGGTTTVTGTMSGSAAAIARACAVHEVFLGTTLDQNPANRAATSTTPTSTATSTTTAAKEYLFGACFVSSSITTASSPWTLRESATFGQNGTEDQSVTATGAYTATFTPNQDVVCGISTFK